MDNIDEKNTASKLCNKLVAVFRRSNAPLDNKVRSC